MKIKYSLLVLSFTLFGYCQEKKPTQISQDSIFAKEVEADFTEIDVATNSIGNSVMLTTFYDKLYQLETQKKGKINIVHIGDSHVQADLFTAKIRRELQSVFGNGGFGFTFPYSVAKTNNSAPVRYTARGNFESFRNMKADLSKPVGLSGMSFETTNSNFTINLSIQDKAYFFNTLKIVTPKNAQSFAVSLAGKNTVIERQIPQSVSYKIKNGDVLGSIANKYNVSLAALKKANGLKSNMIHPGKILKIPTQGTQSKSIVTYEPIAISLENAADHYEFNSEIPLEKIAIVGHKDAKDYALNGIILENNEPGIIYHSIGVNGAKGMDFNKFPLFYEQLPTLQPDLVVISLGTNESFDKQTKEVYFEEITKMITGIRENTPNAAILVMTAPPSVLYRKFQNTYIEEYAELLQENTTVLNYATYDLLAILGGNKGTPKNAAKGYLASDKVHYTKIGYEKQAELFVTGFMHSYENYKLLK